MGWFPARVVPSRRSQLSPEALYSRYPVLSHSTTGKALPRGSSPDEGLRSTNHLDPFPHSRENGPRDIHTQDHFIPRGGASLLAELTALEVGLRVWKCWPRLLHSPSLLQPTAQEGGVSNPFLYEFPPIKCRGSQRPTRGADRRGTLPNCTGACQTAANESLWRDPAHPFTPSASPGCPALAFQGSFSFPSYVSPSDCICFRKVNWSPPFTPR